MSIKDIKLDLRNLVKYQLDARRFSGMESDAEAIISIRREYGPDDTQYPYPIDYVYSSRMRNCYWCGTNGEKDNPRFAPRCYLCNKRGCENYTHCVKSKQH